MLEWISVEDSLPEAMMYVLIHGGIGYFDGEVWRTRMEPECPVIQWEVTHWMPLPEPPKEK